MTAGIDGSATVVVFVTQRYMGKVNGADATDNCQKEFGYAGRIRGAHNMIPVVCLVDIWSGMVWSGMVWGGMVWYGMIPRLGLPMQF